jgi:hypothetical protein
LHCAQALLFYGSTAVFVSVYRGDQKKGSIRSADISSVPRWVRVVWCAACTRLPQVLPGVFTYPTAPMSRCRRTCSNLAGERLLNACLSVCIVFFENKVRVVRFRFTASRRPPTLGSTQNCAAR